MPVEEGIRVKITGDASGITSASNLAVNSLGKLQKQSGASTQALINLSRVAQDAPYGFIGIANNLNPLLESFQRLRAESGTTGATLKALGQSLIGPGGLGLALGVVTSLMVVFSNQHKDTSKEVEAHKKVVDEAAEKEKQYQHALDAAAQSVLNKADKLRELKTQLISTNTEVENLTASTIRLGTAQFLFTQKNEAMQKMLNAEIQKDIAARKTQAGLRATIPEVTLDTFSKDPLTRQVAEAKSQIGQINAISKGLEDAFANLILDKGTKKKGAETEINFFDKFLNFDPTKVKEKSKEAAEAFKIAFEFASENENIFVGLDKILHFDTETQAIKEAAKWWDAYQKGLIQIKPQKLDLIAPDASFSTKVVDALPKHILTDHKIIVAPDVELAGEKMVAFQKQLDGIVSSATASFAIAFGQGIGDILSGGGVDTALKSIVSVMGDFISQLGILLIKQSAAVQAFKKAFATLLTNPVAAIGVGIGLVALGQVIKNVAMPKPKGFAQGGIVTGRTFAEIGEGIGTSASNPEVVAPLDKLKNFINPNGNSVQVLIPELSIGFDALRVSFNRANKQGRLFG